MIASICLVAGPVDAKAALACGDVITADTTLTADLVGCRGNGLVIGADSLSLDLNGHRIDGDGLPSTCPPTATCDVGIDLAGHDGIEVQGGTVSDFRFGIFGQDTTSHLVVRHVALRHNSALGVLVYRTSHSVVADDTFDRNGVVGLFIGDSRRILITHNVVSGSHGYGIGLDSTNRSAVVGNKLHDNDHGVLVGNSSHNVVARNVVWHSGGSSIDIGNDTSGESVGNDIVGNRLRDDGDAIVLTNADRNVIARNVVTGTGSFGFPDAGGFGLILDGSQNDLINHNVIVGSRGPAVYVTSLDSPRLSKGDVVRRNVVSSRHTNAITVDNGSVWTLIRGNTAFGSGRDGIHVDAPRTTITHNRANHNHDWGINATAGVTDGGGNRASGNGEPAQCVGVVCGPGRYGLGP
ncbi:MAG: hypothetical protein QOK15_3904 [Nocardioidaceae bacterium]|nr:hypothetical protein [Nocardioidaceae bacterium]